MIFVDSHVHIYDCFEIDDLFDSALKHFQEIAQKQPGLVTPCFILLLTERKSERWYESTLQLLDESEDESVILKNRWSVKRTGNPDALSLSRSDDPNSVIHIIAGRQIVTQENIEVLGLCSQAEVKDGMSLTETVSMLNQSNAVVVLPWGVGKWFGERGKCVKDFLKNEMARKFYLGDNGGRPKFWPQPSLFSLAERCMIKVLPGSDALPIKEESRRVGSFGFIIKETLSPDDDPGVIIKEKLLGEKPEILPYGNLLSNYHFFKNQLLLRIAEK